MSSNVAPGTRYLYPVIFAFDHDVVPSMDRNLRQVTFNPKIIYKGIMVSWS